MLNVDSVENDQTKTEMRPVTQPLKLLLVISDTIGASALTAELATEELQVLFDQFATAHTWTATLSAVLLPSAVASPGILHGSYDNREGLAETTVEGLIPAANEFEWTNLCASACRALAATTNTYQGNLVTLYILWLTFGSADFEGEERLRTPLKAVAMVAKRCFPLNQWHIKHSLMQSFKIPNFIPIEPSKDENNDGFTIWRAKLHNNASIKHADSSMWPIIAALTTNHPDINVLRYFHEDPFPSFVLVTPPFTIKLEPEASTRPALNLDEIGVCCAELKWKNDRHYSSLCLVRLGGKVVGSETIIELSLIMPCFTQLTRKIIRLDQIPCIPVNQAASQAVVQNGLLIRKTNKRRISEMSSELDKPTLLWHDSSISLSGWTPSQDMLSTSQ